MFNKVISVFKTCFVNPTKRSTAPFLTHNCLEYYKRHLMFVIDYSNDRFNSAHVNPMDMYDIKFLKKVFEELNPIKPQTKKYAM